MDTFYLFLLHSEDRRAIPGTIMHCGVHPGTNTQWCDSWHYNAPGWDPVSFSVNSGTGAWFLWHSAVRNIIPDTVVHSVRDPGCTIV